MRWTRRPAKHTLRAAPLLAVVLLVGGVAPLRAQATAPGDTTAGSPPRRHVGHSLLVIAGLNVLINRFDCHVTRATDDAGRLWACVSPAVWSHNLRRGWAWDVDAFANNLFLHPYHGAMYFNVGRANGLDFWESAPLAFLGSAMWEYFGETELPSLNDLYNTGFGGIVLGEVYHRLGMLIRDDRTRGLGRTLRELAALPVDPVGSLTRWLHGGFSRVGANPRDRHPGYLGLVVQTGIRSARDSGATTRHTSPSVQVDLAYGDAYRQPYERPFDVFTVRMQVGPSGEGLSVLRVRGRLWAKELTRPTSDDRAILTLNQKFEYLNTSAYRFGGQSVELGLVSGLGFFLGIDVRTEVFLEGLMLGAVNAPHAGIAGSERQYDFGPGIGASLAGSFVVGGQAVISARGQWTYLHSVSGSPADHAIRSLGAELVIPLSRNVGLGAYGGWVHRHSAYPGEPAETASFPEARVFLTWQPNRLPPIWTEP